MLAQRSSYRVPFHLPSSLHIHTIQTFQSTTLQSRVITNASALTWQPEGETRHRNQNQTQLTVPPSHLLGLPGPYLHQTKDNSTSHSSSSSFSSSSSSSSTSTRAVAIDFILRRGHRVARGGDGGPPRRAAQPRRPARGGALGRRGRRARERPGPNQRPASPR